MIETETIARMLYALALGWCDALIANNSDHTNAIRDRAMRPVVGDVVFERSRLGRRPYDPSAVGVLVGVETVGRQRVYTVRGLDGCEHRWENAAFIALCSADLRPLGRE